MAYIFDLSDAWTGGAAFTAIKMNVSDGGSTAGSLLMDLQVGGESRFRVGKQLVTVNNGSVLINVPAGNSDAGISIGATNAGAGAKLTFSDGLHFGNQGTFDVMLRREAANTLGQRNGVNAQAFNLYNTYTDASNYERGFMRFVSNVLEIGTQAAGTGTARAFAVSINGTQSLNISTAGLFSVAASGNHQFHTGTTSTAILVSSRSAFGYSGLTYIASGANKDIEFRAGSSVSGGFTDTVVRLTPTGSMEIAKGLTVATLPTPVVGMMARVTDATAPAVGSTVSGGGAAAALCWYNGTNWTVIGV